MKVMQNLVLLNVSIPYCNFILDEIIMFLQTNSLSLFKQKQIVFICFVIFKITLKNHLTRTLCQQFYYLVLLLFFNMLSYILKKSNLQSLLINKILKLIFD